MRTEVSAMDHQPRWENKNHVGKDGMLGAEWGSLLVLGRVCRLHFSPCSAFVRQSKMEWIGHRDLDVYVSTDSGWRAQGSSW